MKRNLITQIKNEWRDNLWVVVGLTIVGLAIWFFTTALHSTLYSYFIPLGFDEEDVYVLSISNLTPFSPDYVEPGEDRDAEYTADLNALIGRLRRSPNVEAAAYTANGSPFNLSFQGNVFRIAGPERDTIGYYANLREATPEIVDVLHLRSMTGKSREYLREKLEAGEILVGTTSILNVGVTDKHSDANLLGRNLYMGGDTARLYHVADVVENVRRSGFDYAHSGTVIMPFQDPSRLKPWDVLIRVKPGCEMRFREELDNDPEMYHQRNTYLYNLRSLTDMRESCEHDSVLEVRLIILEITFMIVIIFLGLLGTFWFRMQQRVSEIAIRRVCGASRGNIFGRVISEGLLLLAVASVFITIIGWIIIHMVYDGLLSNTDLLFTEIVSLALMAVGIVLSVAYPARRAMKIEPAIAIKDE